VVFSAPELLTRAWRSKPKAVIECLFAAASRTFKALSKRTSLQFGIMMVFHSHGKGLSYKAHLHCILTAGGVDSQGEWQPYRQINEKQLRAEFHRWMQNQAARRLPAEVAAEVQLTTSAQWPVYAVYHREDPTALVHYFARTFHGLLIEANARLCYDEQNVRFTSHHLGSEYTITLSRAEFLTRYFAHIPPAGMVTVRHYGLYASRSAATLRQVAGTLVVAKTAETEEKPREESTRTCPLCHNPMSLAAAFLPNGLPEKVRSTVPPRASPVVHGQIIEPRLLAV